MDMHTDTEPITKKTTILLPPTLHRELSRLAEQRHSSIGELVREACRSQYGIASTSDRLAIVQELASFSLPVDTVEQMERESVPAVEPLP
jgi:hypothetical protein